MKLLSQHHAMHAMLLLCIFLLTGSTFAQTPNERATDTIAYLVRTHKDQIKLCDELIKLGTYYWNIGDIDNAQLAVDKSKELAEKKNYEKAIYDAHSISGSISLRRGDVSKAASIANECLVLATRNRSEYGANKANYLLVIMAYQQGNMDSVISLSKRVMEAPHIIYDSITLPRFMSMLANAYLAKGDLYQANRYYIEALDIAEKTNSEPLQVVCIGNLAIINFDLKHYREALKYQRKGLDMAIRNNQMREVAPSYLGMGNIYKNLVLMDSAIYFYRKAVPLYQQFGDRNGVAILNTNLGGLLVYQNQLDSGMYYLASAKHDFLLLNDTINMANNALAMGDAYRRMADKKNDRSYLDKALSELLDCKEFAELKEMEDVKINCYYQLSSLYDVLGNNAKGFEYLKRYTLISDSIRSKEYTGQIAEMQTKYETEKKEIEITRLNAEKLLNVEKMARQKSFNYSMMAIAGLLLTSGFSIFRNLQKKRVIERQVAILEKQNAIEGMRSKIASDVHDEMGANLTRLGLNAQQLLQSPVVPEKEKQLAERMSLQSKEIITGMREIIWSSNPANDNLKSMLGFMRQYIDRFFDGTTIRPVVNFPQDIGEVSLHPEVRRNLFLILKESLNNAVKYSDSDRIDIDFHNEEDRYNLHITDYGKGMEDKHEDEFNNGIRNMQMRAEQIQSIFKLITAPGKGVQISVEGKLY